jgi:integrase
VPLNDAALFFLQRLSRVKSVGYISGDSKPYPATFVIVTEDLKRSEPGHKAWRRVDSARESWKSLLKAAGLWTLERESMLKSGGSSFTRHDVRRTWNAHAKQNGGTTVAERSSVLGHSASVNELHYSGGVQEGRLQEMMQHHPSNNLRLVELACSTGVPSLNLTKLEGSVFSKEVKQLAETTEEIFGARGGT